MDIEKLLAVCETASPGPWHVEADCELEGHILDSRGSYLGSFDEVSDAAFVADARENFPELLRRFKRVRELLAGVYNVECAACLGSVVGDVQLNEDDMEELKSLLSLDGNDGA